LLLFLTPNKSCYWEGYKAQSTKNKKTNKGKQAENEQVEMQQQNSPNVVPERDEISSTVPPPLLPPPSTNLPDFLKNFPSLKDTPGIQQHGWQLVVNDIQHVESPYLKKLLTEWMIYEAKLDPMQLELTGVCVCVSD